MTGIKRKICVITGSRAEYGLLRWLMHEINVDPDLTLQVVACGMHLAPQFGSTYQEIYCDGFAIDWKVDLLLASGTDVGVCKSVGLGVIGFADALFTLAPDVVVILGDRFEALAAAQAAMLLRIPIAHLFGGEITRGAIDESIRHAITKMSTLHFPATEIYRQRIIQLGEDPGRVFNFGTISLDNFSRLKLLSASEIAEQLQVEPRSDIFLVTYHPATLGRTEPAVAMTELLAAIDEFPEAAVIFTMPNADAGGYEIGRLIQSYCGKDPTRLKVFDSLGQVRYLSLLKASSVIIGNSSSGLIEAPAVDVPTVNLGERQEGRLRAVSVIDCREERLEIANAILKALEPGFRKKVVCSSSPYGKSGANVSWRIKELLKTSDLSNYVAKKFHDLASRSPG